MIQSYIQQDDNLCQKHNQPAVAIDESEEQLLCIICLIELTKMKSIIPLTDISFQQFKIKQENQQPNGAQINFQLVCSYDQKEICFAIAFNKDGSIMVSGCDKDIKVWDFLQGELKQKALLKGHTQNITALCYSKRVNKFFSGSQDNVIRLWMRNVHLEWKCLQVLDSHSKRISCIIFNVIEDQFFTSAFDKNIYVWNIQNNQCKISEKLVHKGSNIQSISLNESCTQLVALSDYLQLLIWVTDDTRVWVLRYNIAVEKKDLGFRISFIENTFIILQPSGVGNALFFELNKETDKFEKSQQVIQLKDGNNDSESFPIVYNKQRQILVNKHYKNVYFMRRQDNNQFMIEQTLSFPSHCAYGTVSEDMKYFVVWSSDQLRVYSNQEVQEF